MDDLERKVKIIRIWLKGPYIIFFFWAVVTIRCLVV